MAPPDAQEQRPWQSPARSALPLGYQVAHSQGPQETPTGVGQPTCSPSRQHHPWEGGQGRKRPAGLGGMLSRGAVKRPPGRRSPLPKGGAAPAAGRDWDLCHFQMKFLPPVLPRVRRVEAVAWRGSTSPPRDPSRRPGASNHFGDPLREDSDGGGGCADLVTLGEARPGGVSRRPGFRGGLLGTSLRRLARWGRPESLLWRVEIREQPGQGSRAGGGTADTTRRL